MFKEIFTREKCDLLVVPRTAPVNGEALSVHCASSGADPAAKHSCGSYSMCFWLSM